MAGSGGGGKHYATMGEVSMGVIHGLMGSMVRVAILLMGSAAVMMHLTLLALALHSSHHTILELTVTLAVVVGCNTLISEDTLAGSVTCSFPTSGQTPLD